MTFNIGVQLSTALLEDLLNRGIPVTLTNQNGSRHYATLAADPSRFAELRLQQMQRVSDPAWTLEVSRAIVGAKLANQRAVLNTSGWPASAAAAAQIAAAVANLDYAGTLDAVRGYEGAGAAAYFGAWRVALEPQWGFAGRAFYPPPDPLNALLSFGYTLLMHDTLAAVQLTGLDPYLGLFHQLEAGRPSLALDLMEPFRPLVIDRIVLDMIEDGAVRREQFTPSPRHSGGVDLAPAVRTLLIERYETAMQTPTRLPTGEHTALRCVVLLQAQALARVIRGEEEAYNGYTPDGALER